ncbi:MAG: DUF4012 domain-containing protein [Actinomycetota bacterium]|nr:DUF4012 domain-containing protein [Actinomycetota bacterium]
MADALPPAVPRRRRLWPWLLGAVVIIAAWGAYSGWSLLRAAHRLQAGVAATDTVRGEVSTEDLANNRPAPDLARAHQDFQSAHRLIDSAWLQPLRLLPFFGRQVRSASSLSGAAEAVTAAGQDALSQAHGLLGAPRQTPAQRSVVIHQLSGTVSTLDTRLSRVSLGPNSGLLSVLRTKRATFADDLAKLRAGLDKAVGATTALTDFLDGPRTYLVLAANNAEMRDGSGMFLEVGTVTTDNGKLTLGPFTSSGDLILPQPLVPATGDLGARWGFEHPNQEWRNLGLSPQFDANAALAAAMWQASRGQHVDGVLALDVQALRDLLTVTGPITVNGTTVGADGVQQLLLKDQYVGLSADAPANGARHEQLGQLASATFDAIQAPGTSLPQLATQVTAAVGGRHLLVWAADPKVQAAWEAAGAAGQLGAHDLLLGIDNQGANKLDPYLQVKSHLTLTPAAGDTTARVEVTITNATPPGLSPYAAGVNYPPPGTYVGTVALDFPKSAGQAQVTGSHQVVAAGSDYGADVLAVGEKVLPGQSVTLTFQFVLAGVHGQLRIAPSARLPATSWDAPGTSFTDDFARTVQW